MKKIQVTTDNSIISKLKNAFTSPGTVLSEAMQNARRAGASFVDVRYLDEDAIAIIDDGEGITDLADFLTLAGSGWNEDVIEREGAFGMGSFSMLYYCERIKVESNGFGFEANTADILQHEAISLFESDVIHGTKIQLFGYKISDEDNASRIEQELERLAMAFPITVKYHGEELEQPHRLDDAEHHYFSTPVGEIFVCEYDLDVEKLANIHFTCLRYGSHSVQLYYQGLPLGKTSKYASKNIVHVNEQAFEVRMPDRDVLISHDDAEIAIQNEITALWHKKIDEIRALIGDEVFSHSMVGTARSWDYKHIFNDMDIIPDDVVFTIDKKPVLGTRKGRDDYSSKYEGLTRQEIEKNGLNVLMLEDCFDAESMKVEQYAYHIGALCVYKHSLSLLDKSHWLHDHILNIDEDEIDVEIFTAEPGKTFGCHSDFSFIPCESYRVSGFLGSVQVDDDCFAISEDELLVPGNAADGTDVLLIVDYSEEFGGYDDHTADQDVERFGALLTGINLSREQGFLNLIQSAGLSQLGISNKQLVVTFDAEGKPSGVEERECSEAA